MYVFEHKNIGFLVSSSSQKKYHQKVSLKMTPPIKDNPPPLFFRREAPENFFTEKILKKKFWMDDLKIPPPFFLHNFAERGGGIFSDTFWWAIRAIFCDPFAIYLHTFVFLLVLTFFICFSHFLATASAPTPQYNILFIVFVNPLFFRNENNGN